jgi:hypothetical protein
MTDGAKFLGTDRMLGYTVDVLFPQTNKIYQTIKLLLPKACRECLQH